jgi:hypothetical protein
MSSTTAWAMRWNMGPSPAGINGTGQLISLFYQGSRPGASTGLADFLGLVLLGGPVMAQSRQRRRAEFAMSTAEARTLLAELPVVHLASTLPDGSPVLRTVNSVVVDDWVAFHAAPKGEKTGFLGRDAVLQAEEDLGMVPSTFVTVYAATAFGRSVRRSARRCSGSSDGVGVP